MRKILLLFIIFASQQQTASGRTFERRMLGLNFSPEYSFRILTADESNSSIVDLRNQIEIPKFGYTLGVNFSYRFRRKLILEVGASLSNKGERTKKLDLIYEYPEPDSPVSISRRYAYSFLEIPLRLNYQVMDSSSFMSSIGLAIEIPTFEKVKSFYQYADGHQVDYSFHTSHTSARVGVALIAGMRYYFKLSSKYFLKTEPFLKCNISPSAGTQVKEYFYSYGFDVGIYFSR